MDETRLHKNAGRVAAVFNALSIIVVIVGVLVAAGILIAGLLGAGMTGQLTGATSTSGRAAARLASIIGGVIGAIGAIIYTLIVWAGVQLSAIVAGYIHVRTGPQAVAQASYPQP